MFLPNIDRLYLTHIYILLFLGNNSQDILVSNINESLFENESTKTTFFYLIYNLILIFIDSSY